VWSADRDVFKTVSADRDGCKTVFVSRGSADRDVSKTVSCGEQIGMSAKLFRVVSR
jgi:hypothetical protein